MPTLPSKKTGLARVIAAFFYSLQGFRSAYTNEAAFRQELLLFSLLLPVIFFLPLSGQLKCILLLANTTVLIVELLNSAIEAIVDLVSPEYHALAKQAKDIGSAAVLLSIILATTLWTYAIFSAFSTAAI